MLREGKTESDNAAPDVLGARRALAEAERCLYCFDAPCTSACPVHIDIPGFIAMIRSGNAPGAAWLVRNANALADTCGRICPSEVYCQPACTRGKQDAPVRIRELHLFATRSERGREFHAAMAPGTGKSVAVLGAGPAGLGCAFELARLGHTVDLYNDGPPGGVPLKSIPPFRLPEEDLIHDTRILSRFFSAHDGAIDGPTFGSITGNHDAVFVAVGLGRDRSLGIAGEQLESVFPVLEFLETAKRRPHTLRIGSRVIVVGGGNVSLDAAATARRLGAGDVTLLYRRGEGQMLVWSAEVGEARRLGVEFRFHAIPIEIMGTGHVEGVRCRSMRPGAENDDSGRPVPVEVPGSDFLLPADSVIVAIGQDIRADWLTGLSRTKRGFIGVDGKFQTSMSGVFAGGDAVSGEGTVVGSLAHGKQAAQAIHEYIMRRG
jgi:dihydropyrimidine dehydrogenase (NAD+) subunit PreT